MSPAGARLDGRVALITGGARGQGAAEARLFAAEGARVVVADVLDDEGDAMAAELGDAGRYQHLDVRDPDQWTGAVAGAVSTFGRLDVLVNNAGILRRRSIEEMPLDEYLDVVQVNQVGCWLGMKSALPAMKEAGGGAIVNVSSLAGLEGVALMSAYVATKFAIRGMTKVAAIELGRYGIRVNSVHPGAIATPMVSEQLAHVDTDVAFAHLPVPRVGRPEDVANVVLFLASDESAYCSGAEFVVDGGSYAGQIPRR